MITASIALAVILIEVDSTGLNNWLSQWPRLFGAGAEGARLMLSTLAGSMMTVMGITFSMTLLALVLASGQYTSRILNNFMRNHVTQLTLGFFASIFVYCLIVLRTIRGSGDVDEFVPSLAVFFALLMSIGGVGLLIFFIHHIASSIQAASIIASVAQETNSCLERLLPEASDPQPDNESRNQSIELLHEKSWYPVPALESGYILSVNNSKLLRLASDNSTMARMEHGIGAFVVQDTALVSLALNCPPNQKIIDAFNGAYTIGRHRTVDQDPAFGVRQIVDIAMKALSPGINDTSTAVICVDYLTSILSRLCLRQFPPLHYYKGKTLRIIAIAPTFEGLLAESFDQIRNSAKENVAILVRMLSALDTIGSLTIRPSYLKALDQQLLRIAELVDHWIELRHDRIRLENKLSKVRKTLEAQLPLRSMDNKGISQQEGSVKHP